MDESDCGDIRVAVNAVSRSDSESSRSKFLTPFFTQPQALHVRYTAILLHSSTILARNAPSILPYLSRLPTELSAHTLLFALSTNALTAALSPLVAVLTTLSASSSIGYLSSVAHPAVHIACSLAFLRRVR
jgi:hypothetical protein